ncbi:Transposase [Paracidovorax anthurii]|uniref:Uncharacterized protein n=1 Tax=Paracidovorax anthurii TaxID=78229 RepID=A0A328YHI5_9BURK|nr:hypothetical protein AX018_11191 [Paracidovorax anthurii]
MIISYQCNKKFGTKTFYQIDITLIFPLKPIRNISAIEEVIFHINNTSQPHIAVDCKKANIHRTVLINNPSPLGIKENESSSVASLTIYRS